MSDSFEIRIKDRKKRIFELHVQQTSSFRLGRFHRILEKALSFSLIFLDFLYEQIKYPTVIIQNGLKNNIICGEYFRRQKMNASNLFLALDQISDNN
jgi:hypothetical protein